MLSRRGLMMYTETVYSAGTSNFRFERASSPAEQIAGKAVVAFLQACRKKDLDAILACLRKWLAKRWASLSASGLGNASRSGGRIAG